jgi:hypothetical protein
MITFIFQFYYKDEPCVDGKIAVTATSSNEAQEHLKQMIIDKDERIPGNWDKWIL